MLATTALGLGFGALAVVLAWPVPVVLARARWTHRDPLAALVLWQSVGLAGGLSMIGFGLVYGVAPLAPTAVGGMTRLFADFAAGAPFDGLGPWHVLGLLAAVAVGIKLIGTLAMCLLDTGRQRRRHRELIGLLSQPAPGVPDARLVDYPAPVAYCLPGGQSVMVLSRGMFRVLGSRELTAVIAHERTHLAQRHHMVLLPFAAWAAALPWLPAAARARRAVATLVEMLADDGARRVCDDRTLARAIGLTVHAAPPEGALAYADAGTTAARVERLVRPQRPLAPWLRAVVVGAALALLALPTVALFGPGL